MRSTFGRRLLGWLGFAPGRVLQLEEIRSSAREALRQGALSGLSVRYVPSHVTIGISSDDRRYLGPFDAELQRQLAEEASLLSRERGWAGAADTVEILLETAPGLGRGDPPVVKTGFGPGVDRATWRGGGGAAARGSNLWAGGLLGEKDLLEVIFTSQSEDGTALQERAFVSFGPREKKATGGRVLQRPDGRLVVGREPGEGQLAPSVPMALFSRAHLELVLGADGRLLVRDLGSANGTWLGGSRLGPEPRPLPLPASLSVGKGGALLVDLRRSAGGKA